MKNQKGFTLIELMIVVAIIAILVAIALPAYQDYVRKARFAEVLSVSDAYKLTVGLCGQDQDLPPSPRVMPAPTASRRRSGRAPWAEEYPILECGRRCDHRHRHRRHRQASPRS